MVRLMTDAGMSSGQPCNLAGTRWQRQRVVGVDLWVDRGSGCKEVVAAARCAATPTHLRLATVFEDCWDEEASEDYINDKSSSIRMRFLARCEDVHLTDEAIWELLSRLSGRLRWSRLVKLEEFDGVPNFVPLPVMP
jgi:hypothetical protein